MVAGPYRQVLGEGCVYPAAVPTLGNQLSAAGRSWAAYLQDMGNDPGRDRTVATARGPACGHPATWAIDHTQKAEKGDQYATRHDGFTFFRSVTASQAFCAAHILSFRPLPGDLARAAATPAFSFIAPDLCNDGHDSPCVTGAPGGLAQADAFLSRWVPTIMAAPAYRDGGLIVVTFDEGSDAAACCGETSGLSAAHPNVPLPGKTGPGGGRIGAVLRSPLIKPGTDMLPMYGVTVRGHSQHPDGESAGARKPASVAAKAAAIDAAQAHPLTWKTVVKRAAAVAVAGAALVHLAPPQLIAGSSGPGRGCRR